jgi:amino acid transporter
LASVETGTRPTAQVRKFPLSTLIAMVVGSMVGAGVFSLPRDFTLSTGVFGALIAWVNAGTVLGFLGVLALFASVTNFCYGSLPRVLRELAACRA